MIMYNSRSSEKKTTSKRNAKKSIRRSGIKHIICDAPMSLRVWPQRCFCKSTKFGFFSRWNRIRFFTVFNLWRQDVQRRHRLRMELSFFLLFVSLNSVLKIFVIKSLFKHISVNDFYLEQLPHLISNHFDTS